VLASLLERHGMPDAVLFSLVDHPRVRSETVAALILTFERSACLALRPVCSGRGGHPVLLSASAVRAVMAAPATASTRDVLALAGGVQDLVVNDAGVVDDIDTVGELDAIGASPSRE
jgi:molybdenum cofactor cytidylyltransferase